MKLPNAVARGQGLKRFLYVRGNRRNKVLLVAHADTYWDELYGAKHIKRHGVLCKGLVIRPAKGAQGLGADDRAGCAIVWLLKDLGHSLLITSGEEDKQIGSKWLMNENSDIVDEWLHTLNLCRKWLSAGNLPKFPRTPDI